MLQFNLVLSSVSNPEMHLEAHTRLRRHASTPLLGHNYDTPFLFPSV